ncbi:GIY-YIG nuclease family protein [Candidatus Daviesbacteria bacterium]|nr:GIY-YIG nuclease family protein [Candidatus Daviesbacteria bacterium]
MIPTFLDKAKLPHKPGVYVYKDKTGKVLYVGKAIDLYHRVASYFSGAISYGVNLTHPGGVQGSHLRNTRTSVLSNQIAAVETIVVESELEALILEASLIKKYLPPFNTRLTDDKDYLYIMVSKDDFPKILTARKKDLKAAKEHWGPFPSSRTVKETLKSLRRVFPWCSLSSNLHSRCVKSIPHREWKPRPCFYYHLGLCPGVCICLVNKKDYQKIITRFSKFMDGKIEELVAQLLAEMIQKSKQRKFEEAARIKKILEGITYLTQPNRIKLYLENPNFLEDERQIALEELKKDLKLKVLPGRIEGYDISNIQGKQAAGSMVVLTNGEVDKSQYRRFKINPPAGGSGQPNDVGMMQEIIRRRLAHPEWPRPDLIIIDGGRGQANGAYRQLQAANYQIPIFGLAKRMEWLYPPEEEILKLPKKSLSLKLLQKLRDEAHRFAIGYHRKLRNRVMIGY